MPTINRNNRIGKPRKKYTKEENNYTLRKYYNTSQWHNLAEWYKKHHPFCELCEASGITTVATQVHHKIPFGQGITDNERWRLLLDEDNLMSLCDECHKAQHNDKTNKKF